MILEVLECVPLLVNYALLSLFVVEKTQSFI